MAKIDVYTSEMSALSARLKSISSVIESAEQVTGKVQGNLDFQIAAKADIAGGLSKARKQLRKQKEKVVKMANLTTASEAEFRSADGQMDKSVRNIFGKIVPPLAGMIKGVKQLMVGAAISRYKYINSIFMPAGTIITAAGIGGLISRLAQIINGAKKSGNGTAVKNVVVGGTDSKVSAVQNSQAEGDEETTVEIPAVNVQPYENLVSFSKDSYSDKAKGDYSDYSILGGMSPEYCYNQTSSEYASWFQAAGCLACADACVGSIMGKGVLNPQEGWNWKCKYTTRIGLNTEDDSCKWTPEQIRERTYQELIQGKPVVVRVQSPSSESGGHSVAVVGLKNGADPNHLTDADFLVMDPADGKIKTLSEMKKVNGSDTSLKPAQDNAGMRQVL